MSRRSARLRFVCAAYAKHFALNAGQAAQGLRYLYSHPDIDREAPRGSVRHLALSVRLRAARVVNDVFFAILPPQWHHSPEELASLVGVPAGRWFRYGYCAWRFSDDGAPKDPLPADVDRRWDPRCKGLADP